MVKKIDSYNQDPRIKRKKQGEKRLKKDAFEVRTQRTRQSSGQKNRNIAMISDIIMKVSWKSVGKKKSIAQLIDLELRAMTFRIIHLYQVRQAFMASVSDAG